MTPILPGATLGVMGGGQLGRMFVHAAQAMGYDCAVLDPDARSPAGAVAQHHVRSAYLDDAGLGELARRAAAITTEFENVPARALAALAAQRPVAPGAEAVAICQFRAHEKAMFRRAGVACAPHALVESDADVARAAADAAMFPAILKTARMGYDGKGQAGVDAPAALAAAWAGVGRVACVLEKRLDLALELSVVVARGAGGEIVALPPAQNLHRGGILAVTQAPAPDASPALQRQAVDAACALAEAMGYVGVLCVEFFVLGDGSLVANEMAPRPHNSGHWSIDGCDLDQFQLQVRTLAGLPLRVPRQHSAAVMLNLLGDLWGAAPGDDEAGAGTSPPWPALLALPGVHLHLYGKAEARAGRKMGHLTVTAAAPSDARAVALHAASLLGLASF